MDRMIRKERSACDLVSKFFLLRWKTGWGSGEGRGKPTGVAWVKTNVGCGLDEVKRSVGWRLDEGERNGNTAYFLDRRTRIEWSLC